VTEGDGAFDGQDRRRIWRRGDWLTILSDRAREERGRAIAIGIGAGF